MVKICRAPRTVTRTQGAAARWHRSLLHHHVSPVRAVYLIANDYLRILFVSVAPSACVYTHLKPHLVLPGQCPCCCLDNTKHMGGADRPEGVAGRRRLVRRAETRESLPQAGGTGTRLTRTVWWAQPQTWLHQRAYFQDGLNTGQRTQRD